MAITSLIALEKDSGSRKRQAEEWLQNLEKALEKVPAREDHNKGGTNGGFAGFWRRTTAGNNPPPAEPVQTDPALEKVARELRQAIGTGSDSQVLTVLTPALDKVITYSILESMYLFSQEIPVLRPVVISFLKTIPFRPGSFKTVRHVYKTSEFREDADVFALLAYRLEREKHFFSFGYSREYSIYSGQAGYVQNPAGELQKSTPRLAYSNLTAAYFKRRNCRTLRVLGEDGQDAYVHMASAILLAHSDEKDQGEAKQAHWNSSSYNSQTRQWENYNRTIEYDTYATSLTFNYILYRNSPRYEYKKNTRAWRCKANYRPNDPIPNEREEAFPERWDQQPKALVQLLVKSDSSRVHAFARRALRDRTDLKELVTLDILEELLAKPFPDTIRFALNLVGHFYNPQRPSPELLRMLIHNPLPEARQLVRQWVEAQPDYFFTKTLLFVDLVVNPYEDVWAWTRPLLTNARWVGETAKVFIVRVIAQLLALPDENTLANTAAEGTAQTLLTCHLLPLLQELDLAVVQDLLHHPLPAVQSLGATLLLHHGTPPEHMPQGLISSLIQSSVPAVRQSGVLLFGKLPEGTLLGSYALLSAFCVSPFAEIRQAIQPAVARLGNLRTDFGQKLLLELLPYLSRKEAYPGLHADLYGLFTSSLPQLLPLIDLNTLLRLLHGNQMEAQHLALFVLTRHIEPGQLTLRQVVRMAGHASMPVREYAWQFYKNQVTRIRYEADEALRLLDAKWDDSRQFAFGYFRDHFSANDWTPDRLVSVCDSTRPDVQQFGRELITRFFRKEDGERYLLHLSQHPAGQVQLFATNYLEQFATDNTQNIELLQAYFVTVLSKVNKAGVAKDRIFRFLRREALKHEQVAQLIADIVARQSVTMAVQDKATCISILRDLIRKYPTLRVPLVLKDFTTRPAEPAEAYSSPGNG
jgi:hypothetical protein